MKTVTFDINDKLYAHFVQGFKDCNMALLRNVENAILDGDDDKARDLMRQIIKNLDAIKAVPILSEKKEPVVVKPFQLPEDTKEVIEFRKQASIPQAITNEQLIPHPEEANPEKPKRKRRTKAEMENCK